MFSSRCCKSNFMLQTKFFVKYLSSFHQMQQNRRDRLGFADRSLGPNETKMADERDQLRFEEIHFSPLPSQTNIYGLTKVESNEEGNKVVLASLSGRVVCLEYPPNSLIPSSREVPFTYIPGL